MVEFVATVSIYADMRHRYFEPGATTRSSAWIQIGGESSPEDTRDISRGKSEPKLVEEFVAEIKTGDLGIMRVYNAEESQKEEETNTQNERLAGKAEMA